MGFDKVSGFARTLLSRAVVSVAVTEKTLAAVGFHVNSFILSLRGG